MPVKVGSQAIPCIPFSQGLCLDVIPFQYSSEGRIITEQ